MRLQAGVSKLNEAKALVDDLKRRAAEQSALLKTKQQEADAALQEITTSMQVCVFAHASVCLWLFYVGLLSPRSVAGFHAFLSLLFLFVSVWCL